VSGARGSLGWLGHRDTPIAGLWSSIGPLPTHTRDPLAADGGLTYKRRMVLTWNGLVTRAGGPVSIRDVVTAQLAYQHQETGRGDYLTDTRLR